jgi:hypothetical protein
MILSSLALLQSLIPWDRVARSAPLAPEGKLPAFSPKMLAGPFSFKFGAHAAVQTQRTPQLVKAFNLSDNKKNILAR